jgi:hypothetical protein
MKSRPPEGNREGELDSVAGRASGVDLDVRRDHPYAAYERYPFRVPVYQAGDVLHRMLLRVDEVKESYIPGCPPRPEALLYGILLAVGRLAEKVG